MNKHISCRYMRKFYYCNHFSYIQEYNSWSLTFCWKAEIIQCCYQKVVMKRNDVQVTSYSNRWGSVQMLPGKWELSRTSTEFLSKRSRCFRAITVTVLSRIKPCFLDCWNVILVRDHLSTGSFENAARQYIHQILRVFVGLGTEYGYLSAWKCFCRSEV